MSFINRIAGAFVAGAFTLTLSLSAQAADVNIAVAANFTDAAKEIGAAWEKASGNKAIFSFGATGQLYTQITQAAPFDVFMSADEETVKRAVNEKNAVAGTQFTYAIGKLVLFSRNKDLVKGPQTLSEGKFAKVSIANPAAAPYGAAAVEVMKKLNVYDQLSSKIVQGQNIVQAYQFVDTSNAEIGFVALSQVIASTEGSRWVVSENLYAPIKQDVVLTKRGENSAAARAYLAFLTGPEATAIVEKFGYGKGQ
jgi:molybdate transport system substrate-binding protein